MIEDIRKLLQDFLAPEMREIKARLAALESKVDANEERAEKRHDQVLLGLRQITDYTSVLERLSRLEAQQTTKH